ncbi:MAG: SDR family NAD(P)-dependent oxidoreductase [Acidimicrobiales bacterium]
MPEGRVWFVTGAARGLGVVIARAALATGNQVVATGRDRAAVASAVGPADDLLVTALDVTSPQQAEAAAAAAVERFGRIDVLVNNAGYGQFGYFEELSPAQIERQFATNVFGVMHVTRAVLPYLRSQRAGHVLTISSASGLVGGAGRSAYHSSKFALEGLMECLHLELAPFGIATTVVEPGFLRTEFLGASSLLYGEREVAEYAARSAELRAWHDTKRGHEESDPAKLAQVLVALVGSDPPPRRFVAGNDAYELVEEDLARRQVELAAGRELSTSIGVDSIGVDSAGGS